MLPKKQIDFATWGELLDYSAREPRVSLAVFQR